MITVLIGGARAGKSARALTLGEIGRERGPLLFVATAQPFDDEMRVRIEAHRRDRGTHWHTIESPIDVGPDLDRALSQASTPYAAIVIDCITLWVSNILISLSDPAEGEARVGEATRDLVTVLQPLRHVGTNAIIVTNEVGLGIVPTTALGRHYRDALGRANQILVAAADRVTLMIAGLSMPLKG